jgi:hypothetical protein
MEIRLVVFQLLRARKRPYRKRGEAGGVIFENTCCQQAKNTPKTDRTLVSICQSTSIFQFCVVNDVFIALGKIMN